MPAPTMLLALLLLGPLSVALAPSPIRAPLATTPQPPALPADPARSAGRLEAFRVAGAPFADSLTVHVHLPPGYTTARRYPTVYAFHPVHGYFAELRLDAALDSAVAAGAPPMVAVELPTIPESGRLRIGSSELEQWQRLVLERIVPEVERRYPVEREPGARHLLAFSAGANAVLDLAAGWPAHFGRVAAQSPGWMTWDPERQVVAAVHIDAALRRVDAAQAERWPEFWFAWGDAPEGWEADSRTHGARFVAALRARGAAVEEPVIVPGGHSLRLVSTSLPLALRFLGADAS